MAIRYKWQMKLIEFFGIKLMSAKKQNEAILKEYPHLRQKNEQEQKQDAQKSNKKRK